MNNCNNQQEGKPHKNTLFCTCVFISSEIRNENLNSTCLEIFPIFLPTSHDFAGATLGHTQQLRDNPQTSVQVTWTAPDPPVGPLSFRGIVVVSVQESYTLTPVTSQGDGAPPPEPVGPTDQTPAAAASMLVNVVLMMALLLVLMA